MDEPDPVRDKARESLRGLLTAVKGLFTPESIQPADSTRLIPGALCRVDQCITKFLKVRAGWAYRKCVCVCVCGGESGSVRRGDRGG